MNIFKKIFGFLFIITIISSCQEDDLLESSFDTSVTADVVLGKGKGTKRSTSSAAARPPLQMVVPTTGIGGTVTQTLSSTLAHNVTSIEVTLEATEGAVPAQQLITLEKIEDNGTNARFRATGINFEGDYTPNLALNAQLTFKNETGEAINNEPFEAYPTAQSKNGIYLRKPKIKCELDGSCVFTLKVRGNNADQVASLQGFVSNEAGDIQDVVYERVAGNDEEMEHLSANNPIFQELPSGNNNVLQTLTAYDEEGNILDSQIELVAFPEIDYGPQVGKLALTRFGNSTFYLAQTSVRGTNRVLATEISTTFMQDFSESEFYTMPRIASNENRDLHWRTFDGVLFNINPDLSTTMFGLALDEDENVLDLKKKEIDVQQAAIMPESTSELTIMANGNLQYIVTFNEPQDTDLLFWTVFEDGTRTESGRYRMRPLNNNPMQWIAKNIKPSQTNGLQAGDEIKALQCRFDRGVQAVFDGRLDGEDNELIVPGNVTGYEFTDTSIAKLSGGGIRIKGNVLPKPTSGAPVQTAGITNARVTIPQGNQDGTNLIMNLPLEPSTEDPDVYNFEGFYNSVNTSLFDTQFETEVLLLDEANELLATENVVFDVIEEDVIAISQISLFQNEDGETFSLETEIGGTAINEVAQIAVFITPQDGGSDADPEDFVLAFVEDTFDGHLYRNSLVTFADPDSVIDMEYLVEYTFSDAQGNEVAYLEQLLTATDGSTPRATICMDNGDTPSEFILYIETNDNRVQQLDLLTIQFLNNGEPFTVNNTYDMLRTGSNGDKTTFTLENLEFLNLNEVDNGAMLLTSSSTDILYQSVLSFNNAPIKSLNLGFYNQETGKWQCEDDCLKDNNNNQYCGTTDHL